MRASRERAPDRGDAAALSTLRPLADGQRSPAPRLDAHDPVAFWQRPNFTTPFNCTGGPALALLCGFYGATGLPLSMQIAGRPFDDALVLRAGHAFEMATGFSGGGRF